MLGRLNEERNKALDSRYDHPTAFGLPVIVILDAGDKRRTAAGPPPCAEKLTRKKGDEVQTLGLTRKDLLT